MRLEHHFEIDGVVRRITRRLPVLRSYERRLAELKTERTALSNEATELRTRIAELESSAGPAPAAPVVWKWDVIDTLRVLCGARTYAQVLTPTTSIDMPPRPELHRFGSVTTLRYASQRQRRELAEAVHLPTLDELERTVAAEGVQADVVFVDPWHTYDDSVRTLQLGLTMVAPGGWLVAHDCLPRVALAVTAEQIDRAAWSGETWRAFADVARSLPPDSRAFVIDSDTGVGVIRPNAGSPSPTVDGTLVPTGLDAVSAWEWYMARIHSLIDVVTPDQWRASAPQLILES